MTLADAHADAGADAGSANPSSAPGAGGARAAARVEGFRYVQSLAASAGGRSASFESVGLWGCAALVGSAASTATRTNLCWSLLFVWARRPVRRAHGR